MLWRRPNGGLAEKFPWQRRGRNRSGQLRPPSPTYPQKASLGDLTVQFFVNVCRQLAIGNGPDHAEEWVGKVFQYDPQVTQSSWTKNSIFHCVPKQLDEFFFINHQVNAIVLAVFVLAKPKRFPGAP